MGEILNNYRKSQFFNFSAEQLTNPLVRSKTYNELKPNKGGMESAKPKGLSLRSHSDMNVSQRVHSSSAKRNILSNKDQDCQKLKVTQIDSNGCPISPGKETKVKCDNLLRINFFLLFCH